LGYWVWVLGGLRDDACRAAAAAHELFLLEGIEGGAAKVKKRETQKKE